MFPFNLFPYTNFHDINMDWIIKNLKTLWTKSVFTVNNTPPDQEGNVNLPTVSGMSSVNGIGADGNGNVSIVAKPSLTYYDMQPGDFSVNVYSPSGTVCWRSGVASMIAQFTVWTGVLADSTIATLPNTIPEKCGQVILFGYDDDGIAHRFQIQAGTNVIKTAEAFNDTTHIQMYQTWLTYPSVSIPITAP